MVFVSCFVYCGVSIYLKHRKNRTTERVDQIGTPLIRENPWEYPSDDFIHDSAGQRV